MKKYFLRRKNIDQLYHTIPIFNNPKEEGFGKHCGKRRKCWLPAFSPFPTVFSIKSKREFRVRQFFLVPRQSGLLLPDAAGPDQMFTGPDQLFVSEVRKCIITWCSSADTKQFQSHFTLNIY